MAHCETSVVCLICQVWQRCSESLFFFLKKTFGGHKSFLWGHWCPCYGLLVMSSLSFKGRVGSLSPAWQRCTCYFFPESHLWCDTCWLLCSQHGSWAVLFHIPVSRHWWGSKLGSIMLPLTVWDHAGRSFNDWDMPTRLDALKDWSFKMKHQMLT